MRIGMISEHASPLAALGGQDAGGQNVYVASLARALAARGHEVAVYTRRDDPYLPDVVEMVPGVTVVHVPAGPARVLPKDEMLRWMPDFGRWLAETWLLGAAGRPDVLHANFWMSGVAALTANQLVPGRRIPLVQTFHALGSVKRRFQGARDTSPARRIAVERMLAETADLVLATCSDEVAELHRAGAARCHVRVVPCGVDVERFAPEGSTHTPVPSSPGVLNLVCVGRLVPRKGIDTVVDALPRVPGARLVVVGGPEASGLHHDPEARRLLDRARRHGVADRVELTGAVGQDRLPGLLRRADVVVATPWYEPFGIVPLEAMAVGRPLVGSAVGGLLDTVKDGETGILVPPRDPGALAAALRRLAGDEELRARMGRAARRRAERHYGWSRVAEQVEEAYRSVAAHDRVPALEAL
ncbi:glycosyltransferase [Kineosporia sp. J2-2]|uniref:Glycosyltransferase n=1 Tax=Kineosporia corallincola TaxID=2835133 RepID=A0ABS5TEX0_9ACTN|nr:glycosyltransferase [Kineosporia corallincola]MBT0769632.1 glycosyltransferase [Kineosporia corallincola]